MNSFDEFIHELKMVPKKHLSENLLLISSSFHSTVTYKKKSINSPK